MEGLRRVIIGAALLLCALAAATGLIFHAMDYGWQRDRWFAGHVAASCAMLLALVVWAFAGRRRKILLLVFQISLALLFATGWLAVSAWDDRGNVGRWLGALALPSLPGISYDFGEFGEQTHKLLAMIALWLFVALAARALWRRFR